MKKSQSKIPIGYIQLESSLKAISVMNDIFTNYHFAVEQRETGERSEHERRILGRFA